MKLKINSLPELENLLKGVIRFVSGCRIIATPTHTKIFVGNKEQTIRVFLETNSLVLEPANDEETECQINIKELGKLITAFNMLNDCGVSTDNGPIYLERKHKNYGEYLSYSGKAKFDLKLDKPDATEEFITPALKETTVINDVFSWTMDQNKIDMLTKYSKFNNNVIVNVYFHLLDGLLYADIDNKKMSMISSASLPISNEFEGELTETVCADLEAIRLWSMICSTNIHAAFTDKNCFRIRAITGTADGIKTKMTMINSRLKS